MKIIHLRQHSVVLLVISFAVLSIALSGSAVAQFKPGVTSRRLTQKVRRTKSNSIRNTNQH